MERRGVPTRVSSHLADCAGGGDLGVDRHVWAGGAVSGARVAGPYMLGYFAFLGGNAVGITYAVDSSPQQAGPLLLLICAGRGMISFALSFSIVPLVGLTGYDGAMNIFAIICGILVGLGIPVYFLGGIVTRWVLTRVWREGEAELEVDHHGIPVLRQGR